MNARILDNLGQQRAKSRYQVMNPEPTLVRCGRPRSFAIEERHLILPRFSGSDSRLPFRVIGLASAVVPVKEGIASTFVDIEPDTTRLGAFGDDIHLRKDT